MGSGYRCLPLEPIEPTVRLSPRLPSEVSGALERQKPRAVFDPNRDVSVTNRPVGFEYILKGKRALLVHSKNMPSQKGRPYERCNRRAGVADFVIGLRGAFVANERDGIEKVKSAKPYIWLNITKRDHSRIFYAEERRG